MLRGAAIELVNRSSPAYLNDVLLNPSLFVTGWGMACKGNRNHTPISLNSRINKYLYHPLTIYQNGNHLKMILD